MYQQDLALNNLEGLICHKSQPTEVKCIYKSYDNRNKLIQ